MEISSAGAKDRRRFTRPPDLVHTVRSSYTQWKDINTYDLRCLTPCLTWLRANPDSVEWERAVPVEGVDSNGSAPTAACSSYTSHRLTSRTLS
ncbi:DUF3322 domain-containing protein [Corynebacterium tuberculostearicum]|uniref:DUF3322 domain-containing protein n=1 Tax=Corynebacterium tuberculostearicum TaxID=38304 RepID=UPI00344C21F4